MKNKILLVLTLLISFFYSCRNNTNQTLTPPDPITLQPTAGISLTHILSEPSGIVYNSINNSLMVVSDTISKIFEIDFNGNLIKELNIDGDDLEGICLSKNADTIFVVEESKSRVTSYFPNGVRINSFNIDVSTNSSSGLEGITIDKNYRLFVLNEKLPRLMLEFFNGAEISRKEITYTTDLSDICYDEQADCFWIISDQSRKVIKINKSGKLLGEWLIPFEKGEGITIVQGYMYVVCDADSKMYVFQKP